MKNQKGITIVSLIITIIVMVILAGIALAFSVGENGIITKAEDAKAKTEIATEKEKLQEAVVATIGSSGKVNLDNIVLPDGFIEISKEENTVIYQGPSGQQYEVENETGKITEIEAVEDLEITTDTQEVTFTKSDGVTPGDPNNLKNGDIVIYGDYKYTYSNQGWSVVVLDTTKEQYGKIAEEIFEKPIISLKRTFITCTNLKIAPKIPAKVTNMENAFLNCTSLVKFPKLPDGVTIMKSTFYNCTSIDGEISLPSSVNNLESTFYNCSSLTVAPIIPNGVTELKSTFSGCASLIEPPTIPSNVTNMESTFSNCTSLKTAPILPERIRKYEFNTCIV